MTIDEFIDTYAESMATKRSADDARADLESMLLQAKLDLLDEMNEEDCLAPCCGGLIDDFRTRLTKALPT